jgi:hypothetical protein
MVGIRVNKIFWGISPGKISIRTHAITERIGAVP